MYPDCVRGIVSLSSQVPRMVQLLHIYDTHAQVHVKRKVSSTFSGRMRGIVDSSVLFLAAEPSLPGTERWSQLLLLALWIAH